VFLGVFYLFLTDFDVIDWVWAWGVLSPMTAGSVGAVFIYFLTDFDVIDWGWAWGVLSPMTAVFGVFSCFWAFFIYF